MMDVDGLFGKDDEQPNNLTEAQIMQQQMREFNRLLANGQNEKKGKRLVTVAI